ncbi:MAG: CopD family protein [Candidatus Binataceae bacterium]
MNWFLIFHLFGIIIWVGGLLMLASLLGLAAGEQAVTSERMFALSGRMLGASYGGLAVTIIFGILLIIAEPGVLQHGWLHIKLVLVFLMIVAHVWLHFRTRKLSHNPERARASHFMIMHGVISALLLGILILVFLKPF